MSDSDVHDPLYVAARRVLLDALDALGPHRDAIVLVGAQAVYLRTGDAGLSIAPYTTDADLAIDPERLRDEPLLEQAMAAAGFHLRQPQPGRTEPGVWIRNERVGERVADVPVDLLVPERFAPRPGSRSAHLPPHQRTATRRTPGLEPALLDHDPLLIASLERDIDQRELYLTVAGPAALLIAKAHKLNDRLVEAQRGRLHRLDAKDAGDVVRLMRTQSVGDVQARMRNLLGQGSHPADQRVSDVVTDGLGFLFRLFGQARSPGTQAAVDALAGALPEDQVRALCVAYTAALVRPLLGEVHLPDEQHESV